MRRDASSELQDFKGGSLFLQAASKGGLVYRKDRKKLAHPIQSKCSFDIVRIVALLFNGSKKENQGAVVIVFTRTAPQAASVAAAKDFPARAAPSCALIGLPVTALVCSNGNQGQLVFCKQHGAAIKEKLQKSPRLAKEGSLSATDHHAVSETQHK
ncbi:unnamed protein product [Prunus armeniaca]